MGTPILKCLFLEKIDVTNIFYNFLSINIISNK